MIDYQVKKSEKIDLISKKLFNIISDELTINKNGANGEYSYITERDVVLEFQKQFKAQKLIYTISVLDKGTITLNDNGIVMFLTTATCLFTLIDVESGQFIEYIFVGDGSDSSDKGIYKAITGCQKYFFTKNFLVATGDDPEKDVSKPIKHTVVKSLTQEDVKPIIEKGKIPSGSDTSMQIELNKMLIALYGKENISKKLVEITTYNSDKMNTPGVDNVLKLTGGRLVFAFNKVKKEFDSKK